MVDELNTPAVDPAPVSAAGEPLLGTPAAKPADPATPPVDPAAKPVEAKPDDKPAEAFDVSKLTLPEGMTLDAESSKKFGDIMSEAKVPAEVGQKLMDLYGSEVKKFSETMAKTYTDMNNKWRDEVKADKEIGGDKLDATLQTVSKALDTYGDPGVREALNLTGAGNNPAVIRTLFKMAKALTESGHVVGGPPSAAPKSLAEKMYPQAQGS